MSDLDAVDSQIDAWLQPIEGDAAPCGPDLEYDNDFLALTQAAAGKPESQIGDVVRDAEPPDWRKVRELAESLLERSRDLRFAVYWLRSGVQSHGFAALVPGLRLINGMLESMWEGVHPLPDPDDGDPYARVNALTLLREHAGLIGDLRACHVVRDRAVGELTGRAVELAAGLAEPFGDETVASVDSQRMLVEAALERQPDLRAQIEAAVQAVATLESLSADRLGNDAPDLTPLKALVGAVQALLPGDEVAADDGGAGAGDEGAAGGSGRGLSGGVNSRADALRAIDMVCQYLERHEPTNPAPLFLRRARHLVDHNFLQLVKELAPAALPDVARMVGVDPESVETPGPS